MANWYPNVESYSAYLSKNSYIRDINGQIMKTGNAIQEKISNQTYEIVANQEQLSKVFGNGFNSINNTLDWGFDQLANSLQDINASIDTLHSDFVYGIGLLLTQTQINNKLLTTLIDKIDAIHKTLQNPTLTKAREFYRLGSERFKKGLLDKALEAFIEAEKNNDTDFFTQYSIGLLYLYGRDDDDNVVDLEKAKQHLLYAARYAKAEIIIDSSFAKFAAEALLNASFSVYFQLGDDKNYFDTEKKLILLNESKELALEAVKYNPNLSEGYYHLAIYSALLGSIPDLIFYLNKTLNYDRKYAVKICKEHAFDVVRSHVDDLLKYHKVMLSIACLVNIYTIKNLFAELSAWHPENSIIQRKIFLETYKQDFISALNIYYTNTYYGFLDLIPLLDRLILKIRNLISECIGKLEEQIQHNVNTINSLVPYGQKYTSEDLDKIIIIHKSTKKLLNDLDKTSYDSFIQTLLHFDSLVSDAKIIRESIDFEDLRRQKQETENYRRTLKEEEKKRALDEEERKDALQQKKRNRASKDYAVSGAWICGLIGSLVGCVNCAQKGDFKGDFSDFLGGTILGIIVGVFLGAVFGQLKKF